MQIAQIPDWALSLVSSEGFLPVVKQNKINIFKLCYMAHRNHVHSQFSMFLRWSSFIASRGILTDNSRCDFPKLLLKSALAPLMPAHTVAMLADVYGVPAFPKTLVSSAL